jgi:CBS domain-containing protein
LPDDTNLSTEISLYVDKPFNLKEYYDFDSFPESKGFSILPYQNFTRDFLALDEKCTSEIAHICESHLDKLVDLRPYIIENPETCTKFDFLPKILSRFQHLHLRHLPVVNPVNGQLEGMITRQDIFTWMSL